VAGQRPAQPPPGREELRALADEFFEWRRITQPITSDDVARVERPDGWVPDFSPEALRRIREKLEDFRRRFDALRPGNWAAAERVDYLLLRSAMDRVDWELNVLRSVRRNPNFYVDQTIGLLFEALTQPPPFEEARARNIILRVESIPNTLIHARMNLTEGAAPFADVALAPLEGIAGKLERVRASLEPLFPETQRARLSSALRRAATALEQYAAWLREKKLAMGKGVAVGREAYERYLKRIALVPYSSDEILQMGVLEWNRSVAFEAYAQRRNRNLPAARLFRDSAEQIAASAADEESIRRFLVEKGILDLPGWMGHYRKMKAPEYLVALDYPGVPDDLTSPSRLGRDAVSYIPEPSPKLAFFARASAEDPRPLIVHEGVPGHFLQLALSWANEDSIRRHYFDSGPSEGVGFYAEELTLQFGLFDDRPHTLEIIYRFLRLRALRVTADIKLARGEFSIDDAARYLAATVPMDEATARQEAAFFATSPGQAISYQVGKLQIMKFLADARTREGEKFNLKEFHNSLWKNGNVPIALQRWESLGLEEEMRKLW
jgi:uncharacterized protein (DUF885 family)